MYPHQKQQISALKWLDEGHVPVPCVYRSKKASRHWKPLMKTPPARALVARWFQVPGLRNLAIIVRAPYVIVDFDVAGAYEEWREKHPNITTRTVQSSRGPHLWFAIREPVTTFGFAGGDVKSGGNTLATIPPSTHPDGHKYYYRNDGPILTIDSLHDIGITPAEKPEFGSVPAKARKARQVRHRLPESFGDGEPIARIKGYLSVPDVLSQHGIEIERNGNCKCPFHDDNNPSMSVYNDFCKCHVPGCRGNRGFDTIDLVRELNNLQDISHTVSFLLKGG